MKSKIYKKMDREIAKVERGFKSQISLLNEDHLNKSDKLIKLHKSEINDLKIELSNTQRQLTRQISKNKQLEDSLFKLKDDLEIQRDMKRPTILVVGNLPENSILDTQMYRILTTLKIDLQEENLLAENTDLIKVYLQSEYVSMGEYLAIKKGYPNIPLEYTSRENMKKGN